ncbi:twin-arginine translocation signal domain-containing protein [Halobellus captivus]|uniref:twin-arginine translocation signal domain-containing protein n=1 Tax=Halobellus captivus TaxID=2592614 RepID=UPI0011A6BB91|nr:twin-arginine translocation signal domain-containing protein [Halobellus captivus]
MTWRPTGIVVGEAFSDYVARLRETYKHAADGGNVHSIEPMPETHTDDEQTQDYRDAFLEAAHYARPEAVDFAIPSLSINQPMTRRTFLYGVGAAAATAATAGVGAAQSDAVPNFDSEYTPIPHVEGAQFRVGEHDASDMGALDYVDNDGNVQSFTDEFGAVLAPDPEDEDEPHNPVGFHPSRIQTEEYTAFPRGETYDDGDDEDAPVRAVDSTHWSTDEADTSGSITVEDADDDALSISTSGQGSGDVASATFSDFEIGSGEARKTIQLVLDIDQLEAGAVVDVNVVDASGSSVTASIDPDADEADDSTIAIEQGSGIVYQTEIGELDGGTDLDTLDELIVEVSEANAELTIHGINLELDSEWSFGTRETYDSEDEEIQTETLVEPAGMTWITSLSSLTEQFGDATIVDLEYEVEVRADEAPLSNWEIEVSDVERSEETKKYHLVGGLEIPGGLYEVEVVEPGTLVDEVRHPDSVYQSVEYAHDLSELPTIDEVDNVEWTDATSVLEDGDSDSEVEISTTVTAGDTIGLNYDLREGEQIVNAMVGSSGGGGAAPASGGGFMSSIWGWVTAGVTGILGAIGIASWISSDDTGA